MSTTKPRITVTLEPRSHEVLARLSAVSHQSMSAIVAQFVDVAVPSLERVVVVLERAKAAPQETLAGVAASVERASRDVIDKLQAAMGQGDMFLGDLAKAIPDAPKRPKAVQRGGSTPVPVTRGSGLSRKVRKGSARGAL